MEKFKYLEVKADIRWLTSDEGGRLDIIDWSMDVEKGYPCIALFEGSTEELKVQVFVSPGASCFLIRSDEPCDLQYSVAKGSNFELKNGQRILARGVIR